MKNNWYKNNIRQIMRISFLFVAIQCSMAVFLLAREGSGQAIDLDFDRASVVTVFDAIERQSDVSFTYDEDELKPLPRVSIRVNRMPLEKVLLRLEKQASVAFKQSGKLVGVTVVPADSRRQTGAITGTVTEAGSGEPLAGVNVVVKETTRGAFTDKEGTYTIQNLDPGNYTLRASYVGYQPVEKSVAVYENDTTEVNFALQAVTGELGEVVVNAGYYSVKEREQIGNIEKVISDEIELQPIVSPLEALQGRMAGVEVVQQSGMPGASPSIKIRGQNSLRNSFYDNGNLPLYVIDGVPVNSNPIYTRNYSFHSTMIDPLSGLNLSNIESIEVLKDADATAIYGSRGANGVILITTKSGSNLQNKISVEARLYSGVSKLPNKVDFVSTERYLDLRRAGFENAGRTPTEANAFDLLLWDQTRNTDWQEELLGGSAVTTNANISISGGNETTTYRLNGAYQKQGSIFPGENRFHKSTVGLNLNHLSRNKKFQITLSTNYGVTNNNFFSSNNFVSLAFSLPPNAPALYNEDGSLNWENSTWTNPVASLNSKSETTGNNLIANTNLSYQLIKGITLKTNLGYSFLNSEDVVTLPKSVYDPANWDRISHRSSYSSIGRKSWIIEPQVQVDYSWNGNNLDAIVGLTFQDNENSSLRMSASGYSNENLIGNLNGADIVNVTDDIKNKYKYNAVFARIGYNLNHTYFLNLTGRRDGSSRFGPNNRFANFGAIGTAWIFSEEDFVKSGIPFLSFGKLRGSYGLTGNDQIGDYRYLDAYNATPGPNGLYPVQLTNPNFSWETNKKLEAAIELGFLKDRLRTNLSWYRNRSSNQLVGYPLPAMTGFTTVEANLPATVQNTGWEVELTSLNVQSKELKWETSFNITFPKNELIAFPELEQTSYRYNYRVGYPLSLTMRYQYEGVNPETGLYSIVDVNDDGTYDFNDQIVLKDIGRKFYGGIHNQVSYQNFSLGILVEFVKQDGWRFYDSRLGGIGNYLDDGLSIWQNEGDIAQRQKPSVGIDALFTDNYFGNSQAAIVDASFIRLKTITLGYSLPQAMISRLGLTSSKIFFHAQNLFTITDYVGLDPQNPGGRVLPALQSVTGGLQLNF